MKRLLALVLLLVWLPASLAFAQARDGKLQVTVVDPTNAVLPSAVVTITGLEDATKAVAAALKPATATDKGIAQFDALLPGRYTIEAEFPGFEKGALTDVRIKSGDNKHVIVLALQKLNQSVTVAEDKQASASARSSDAFGSALTREQIEALSDDPDEMQKQLQAMAGPDAVLRVDGFEGQPLPNKAQIKSIHITRDQFAAENHAAGLGFIDIVTAPGVGPLRASARGSFYDSALDGHNAFAATKGPSQNRSFGGSLGGTIVKDKSDFSISFNGNNAYTTPIAVAVMPDGTRVSHNLDIRQPNSYESVSGLLTYALTKDQTLRLSVGRFNQSSDNQGIGQYESPEHAYSSVNDSTNVRIQEVGPLGRRFFTNTRLAVTLNNSSSQSVSDKPTIVVPDAFTLGGAQRRGGTKSTTYSLASDLDYVRGKHSFRTGLQIDGTQYHSDAESNYLGTYTFASVDAYNAGTPLSFTQRLGNPNIDYSNVQAGLYAQDDWRLKKSLVLSAGVRYEAQTHVGDYANLQPRAGLTWAPFKSGHTTLRGSWGIFNDWFSAGLYGQTVQIDGFHQQEVNLFEPSYPSPGNLGPAPATNRYVMAPGLRLPTTNRVSFSASQTINKELSVGMTYADMHGTDQFVGQNLNAPIDGARPDPVFANIIEVTSAARSKTQSVSAYANWSPTAATMVAAATPGAGKLFDWRRNLFFYLSYGYYQSENNTDGAFSVPATGSLDAEWGPSSGDVHHRVSVSMNSGLVRNLSFSMNASYSSAPPITIRTGFDDNGDLIFNDRPAGVGRNSARTVGQWYSSIYASYAIGLGKKTVTSGQPGIMITSSGAGPLTVATMAMPAQPRYRLILSVSLNNPTNHQNYSGFSGVMTSPYFLQPTSVNGVRQMTFSATLTF
jgi:hypothetical protein